MKGLPAYIVAIAAQASPGKHSELGDTAQRGSRSVHRRVMGHLLEDEGIIQFWLVQVGNQLILISSVNQLILIGMT